MKKIAFLLLAVSIFAACEEKYIDRKPLEEQELLAYLTENNITAQPLASGLYYIPEVTTDGREVLTDKYVRIVYSVWLTNGKRLTKAQTLFHLVDEQLLVDEKDVTQGFNQALKLMREGEKAKFIIPSDLAYGSNTYGDIPAYSTLIYEIEMISADLEQHELDTIEDYISNVNPDLEPQEDGTYFHKTYEITADEDEDGDELTYPEEGDVVEVAYEGYFVTGNFFDKSGEDDDLSVTIGANAVVKGFESAILQLKVGEKCTVLIPSEFAYGVDGNDSILPFTPILFNIERTK